jgi:hydroxyacyl-ACP dehydratase HTD2-like protein with hotdog domain
MTETESVRVSEPAELAEHMPAGRTLAVARFTPGEIDLFMFCAATWNTHRIHYDRDFARREGYRDLVVPGPMQSARLAQMLADFAAARGGRLHALNVRHRSVAYCNEPLDLLADATGVTHVDGLATVQTTVAVLDAAGAVTTSGAATLVFTGAAADADWISALRRGAA